MAPYTGAHFAGRSLTDRAGTRFNYTADGIRIEKAGEAVTTPVAWTFGSGEQAITCYEQALTVQVSAESASSTEPAIENTPLCFTSQAVTA